MNSSNLIPIKVPLKRTAYIYIKNRLKPDEKPLIVSNKNSICSHLLAAMKTNRSNKSIQDVVGKYPCELEFFFTDTFFLRNGSTFMKEIAIREFNNQVEEMFKEEFMLYMNVHYPLTGEQHNTIYSFLAKYDPEEVYIKFDALKKHWQRHGFKL